jgi:hypothetical protein
VVHPRTNGQVKRANGTILQGIKPTIFNKLDKFGGKWINKLPAMLWSMRTTHSRATGHTPFFMVYDVEAIFPTNLEYGAPRVMKYKELEAKEFLKDALDQLDKARNVALLHPAKYQQALRWYHSRQVKGRAFNISDLVLHLV